MAEYIVTVKEDADWQELHNELVANNIEVAKVRQSNSRSTHYHLTKPQADDLKNDSRVLDIQLQTLTNNISTNLFQDQDFEKTNSNWGLIRHINKTNIFGNSLADPGNTYDYVLDGTGVDVVIVDTGIQADHPEFQDANGVSRVKTINWFDASGVSGTQSSSHYQDPDGHGTHVAGIVAGKTHGWAKEEMICLNMEKTNISHQWYMGNRTRPGLKRYANNNTETYDRTFERKHMLATCPK